MDSLAVGARPIDHASPEPPSSYGRAISRTAFGHQTDIYRICSRDCCSRHVSRGPGVFVNFYYQPLLPPLLGGHGCGRSRRLTSRSSIGFALPRGLLAASFGRQQDGRPAARSSYVGQILPAGGMHDPSLLHASIAAASIQQVFKV
jgi:hypothetical protein